MKVPPKKPHFLKPILPGFKQGLKIPVGFLRYLEGQEHKHAILRRNGKKWQVKLNGPRFEEGWEKFAEEHDLQLGSVLEFRHEGDMEFEVTILDSSQCDTEYVEHLQEVEEETPKKSDLEGKPKIMSSDKAFPNVEAAKDMPLDPAQFTCTLKSYYLSNSCLRVPTPFVRESGLCNRKCKIIIRDEQRSWIFSLNSCGKNSKIGGGWRNFCLANCLKEGDRLMFEIVTNGEIPMLKFYDPRGSASLQPEEKKTNLDTEGVSIQERPKPNNKSSDAAFPNVEAAIDMPLLHPHFICTMKPYYLANYFLFVPRPFARLHSLRNKECAITINDNQRSWTFSLHSSSGHTYIGGKWHDFCAANCLRGGDYVMFEMVANGEKPTFKFHDLKINKSLQPEGKKTSLDAESVSTQDLRIETSDMTAVKEQLPTSTSANPHFISTIRPYAIKKAYFYISLAFAKSNGLTNRCCEMILIDEQRRSWSVRLQAMSNHIKIIRGWNLFKKANNVQVGDTYKFELIHNDTLPIVYFHCKYAGKDAPGITEALDEVMKQFGNDKGEEN